MLINYFRFHIKFFHYNIKYLYLNRHSKFSLFLFIKYTFENKWKYDIIKSIYYSYAIVIFSILFISKSFFYVIKVLLKLFYEFFYQFIRNYYIILLEDIS
jgi:hypothetical protein